MSMRAFVAIEVPAQVLDSLVVAQKELSSTGADLKLVERVNLHFTVKFLGEISETKARDADARLKELQLKSAKVEVRGIGVFSPSRPRVVWAGVPREHEGLISLIARSVIDALRGIGEEDDRQFQPHITLARVRSVRNIRELKDAIGMNASRPFGSVEINSLTLKSSQLTPSGPVYSDVGVYQLK